MFTVKKAAPKITTREYFIRKAKKSQAGKDALLKLNDYLNANTAEPMYWLHHLFTNQQNAITFKELREAIKNGYMDEATLQQWQKDYANFVVVRLDPLWRQAAEAGALEQYSGKDFVFDPGGIGMSNWIVEHGGKFISCMSEEARCAIQSMISASSTGQYTVDELSRAIRPLIGLNEGQARANMLYYENVKATLLKNNPKMRVATAEKRAREAALKYRDRQLRHRAQTIAQTELAAAYCAGNREFVIEAQAKGYMGPGFYEWDTADDEAVCRVCGGLNGAKTDENGTYYLNGQARHFRYGEHPPAHPNCRCCEHFVENGPPKEPQVDKVEYLRSVPRSQVEIELGGENGGKQRASVVTSGVITDDVDLRSLYRSKVVVNQDSQNNQPLQAEITLKPLTELKEGGILTISDKALEHSTVGEFTSLGDPNKPPSEKNGGRMRGGGHSQAGIEELERRGIKYRIEKTLKNGVRVGGVELHKTAEKQIGKCGQSWFPIDWTEQDVRDAGTYVLNHPRLRTKLIRGGVTFGYEYAQEYRGVTVLVRASNQNEASTIYPDGKQRAVDGGDWDGFESCTEPYRVDEVVR